MRVKELTVRTESGSQYTLIRESGSAHSMWLVQKAGRDMGVLLCFGKIKTLHPGLMNVAKGEGEGASPYYLEHLDGNNSEIIDSEPKKLIIGQRLFFARVENLKYWQEQFPYITSKELAKQGRGGLTEEMRKKLGRSTEITHILEKRPL